jgi:hypothetical protein
LAKWIGAKVTALTVLPPFHTFTTDTQMLGRRRRFSAKDRLALVMDFAGIAGNEFAALCH